MVSSKKSRKVNWVLLGIKLEVEKVNLEICRWKRFDTNQNRSEEKLQALVKLFKNYV